MPPPLPASGFLTRLTLDDVHRKELATLGTARRAITADITRDHFLFSGSTRLKGPFVLTGYTAYDFGKKDWKAGARLTAKWN